MSRSPKRSFQFGGKAPLPVNPVQSISQQQASEIDYLKQRVQDLENDKQVLQEEADYSAQQIYQSGLQVNPNTKTEIFIQENAALHLDNDKLSKLVRQKKTDAEMWKTKYENQMSQVIQIKANYESEIRELSSEVQKLHAKIVAFDFDKEKQVLEQKASIESHAQREVENAKKTTFQQVELLEIQVRKLRDQIDQQNNQIDDLQAKLLRTKTEDDHQVERLLRENENLRNRISEIEVAKQREFEDLNENNNQYTLSQIDNLKKEFQHQSDVTEMEVEKLRGLLDIKNVEIETLLQQNQKNKVLWKEETSQLRDEVLLMKQKLLEQERQNRNSLEELARNLTDQHNRDTDTLRQRYQNQLNNLEAEIGDLKSLLDKRELEIQIQQDEKAQLRTYLESQIYDLTKDLEQQKLRYYELEQEKNREIAEQEDSFKRSMSQIQEHCDQQRAQIHFLEGEVSRLKELLDQKNKELDSHIQQFSLHKRGLEDDIRRYKYEVDKLRQELLNLEQVRNAEIEDLKVRLQRQEIMYRDKLRQLEIALEQVELDCKRFREQLDVKGQEIDNLLHQRTSLERDMRRAKDETEQLKTRLIQLERERNIQLEDLRNKLDASNQYQIDQLKAAFNTQIQILTEENHQLRQTLELRKGDIQELLEKYEQLKLSFKDGGFVNPDAAATKSIYDVYLKSKRVQSGQKEY